LIQDHPAAKKSAWRHVLLPGLFAMVISGPLSQLRSGLDWWGGLFLAVIFLAWTIVAEYIALDLEDERFPLAAAWLTAVGFALFLILAVTIHASGLRLYFTIPLLMAAGWLVIVRTLYLRLPGQWMVLDASLAVWLAAQWIAALRYWPLSASAFGIAATGIVYALTSFIAGLAEEKTLPQASLEPLLGLILALAAGYWLR
jgi:hypothetical protein